MTVKQAGKRACALAQVAAGSMPLYATLPELLEAAVERGWTRAYSLVGDVDIWVVLRLT